MAAGCRDRSRCSVSSALRGVQGRRVLTRSCDTSEVVNDCLRNCWVLIVAIAGVVGGGKKMK